MPVRINLFDGIPEQFDEEFFTKLYSRAGVRIERIVSRGHASPAGFWYDQPQHEWVIVLKGAARLRFENDQVIELKAGDYLAIPAHQKHRVEWTSPDELTIWLAVHHTDGASQSPARSVDRSV